MKRLFRVFLLIEIFYCQSIYGQLENGKINDSFGHVISVAPDSQKIKMIADFAIKIYKSDPEQSMAFAFEGLRLSVKTRNYQKEAKFINLLGVIHSFLANYDSAYYYFILELKIGEKNDDKTFIAKSLTNLGLNYSYQSENDSALYYYLKALEVHEEMRDTLSIANNLSNIGNLYYQLDNLDKAISYLTDGMKFHERMGNKTGIANNLNSLGLIYVDKGQVEKAFEYYSRSYKLKQELNDKFGMANTLSNLARLNCEMGNHELSLANTKIVLSLRNEINDRKGKINEFVNISVQLQHLKRYREAIAYADSGLRISLETGDKLGAREAADGLSYCYSKLNDFQKAYEYHKLYKAYNDSIVNENKTRQLTEIETRYKTEKKEKENALLTARIELKQKQLLLQKTKIYILIGMLFFLVMASAFILNYRKQKQQRLLSEERLKQEQLRLRSIIDTQESERKRIALELHDGLGQMLSAARMNVAAIENANSGNNSENRSYINALSLIDESCVELRNISHDMMPTLLVRSGLVVAIEELAEKNNSSARLFVQVDHDGNVPKMHQDIEISIFRIIQELLTNIIKYAEATEVFIQLNFERDELMLTMEDNGKGLTWETIKLSLGNGWHNIQSRLDFIKGKVEIDSKPGNGTIVYITVPLQDV